MKAQLASKCRSKCFYWALQPGFLLNIRNEDWFKGSWILRNPYQHSFEFWMAKCVECIHKDPLDSNNSCNCWYLMEELRNSSFRTHSTSWIKIPKLHPERNLPIHATPPKSCWGFWCFPRFSEIQRGVQKSQVKNRPLHPGRLTWNIQITHLERKMIFQTPMIMFHVNLPGCTFVKTRGFFDTKFAEPGGRVPASLGPPALFRCQFSIFNYAGFYRQSSEFTKLMENFGQKKKHRDEKSWDFTEF